ncbi:MAG: hypothetical protein ACXWTG_10200 [Methylosarcina sp.]
MRSRPGPKFLNDFFRFNFPENVSALRFSLYLNGILAPIRLAFVLLPTIVLPSPIESNHCYRVSPDQKLFNYQAIRSDKCSMTGENTYQRSLLLAYKTRIGLIGYGKTGKAVANVLSTDSRFELCWIARRTSGEGAQTLQTQPFLSLEWKNNRLRHYLTGIRLMR